MDIAAAYDPEVDVLVFATEQPPADGISFDDDINLVVKVGTMDGNDVVALMLINATSFLSPHFIPLRQNGQPIEALQEHPLVHYDQSADRLDFGRKSKLKGCSTTANGRLTAHWQLYEVDAEEQLWKIVGASVNGASLLLAPFFSKVHG